jgi:hypothetical protein
LLLRDGADTFTAMSTITVELPDTPEIREGDEVTIRARMTGSRLVAENVRHLPAPHNGQTEEDRRAALDELFRLRDESPAVNWTDEDLDRMRMERIKTKHLK